MEIVSGGVLMFNDAILPRFHISPTTTNTATLQLQFNRIQHILELKKGSKMKIPVTSFEIARFVSMLPNLFPA
jgi:hypothetical protein